MELITLKKTVGIRETTNQPDSSFTYIDRDCRFTYRESGLRFKTMSTTHFDNKQSEFLTSAAKYSIVLNYFQCNLDFKSLSKQACKQTSNSAALFVPCQGFKGQFFLCFIIV